MKKYILALLLLIVGVCTFAQESRKFSVPTYGYRGFGGLNTYIGCDDKTTDRFTITTIHGFQIDNLYVGMGVSMQFSNSDYDYDNYYYYDYDEDNYHYYYRKENEDVLIEFLMPFFFNGIYEFCRSSESNFKPYVDMRIGYALGDVSGLYMQAAAGVRVAHINIWAGFNMQQDKLSYYGYDGRTRSICNYYNSIAVGIMFDWGSRR